MESFRVRRIKGDIVEAICRNHFAAMNFQIENAGVEHFATKFANRSARHRDDSDGSNVGKIQNYIGHLPDLLVGHDEYDYHFVEAKFRDSVPIATLAKELLWDYRKQIFGRDPDSQLFRDITRRQWDSPTSAYELTGKAKEPLESYYVCVSSGHIDPSRIFVPMMFYVLIKQDKTFQLYLIRFDDDARSFQIHQAGNRTDMISTDIATAEFISLFDKSYGEVVVPILKEVFSAEIELPCPTPVDQPIAVLPNSILELCIWSAREIQVGARRGVYFKDLLKIVPIATWLTDKKLPVDKESLKYELEKCGLSRTASAFKLNEEEISLHIKEYGTDFDFYTK